MHSELDALRNDSPDAPRMHVQPTLQPQMIEPISNWRW
jgi:hypothetical protein